MRFFLVERGRIDGPGTQLAVLASISEAAIVSSLEAQVAMWERKPARRVRAFAIDGALGCWLAALPQGE